MFSTATRNFVEEIDDGSLVPVSSLIDSDKLVPLSLIVKRKRFWIWQKPKYLPTDFTLSDVLTGDTPLTPGKHKTSPSVEMIGCTPVLATCLFAGIGSSLPQCDTV
jgi:hypothetical protein